MPEWSTRHGLGVLHVRPDSLWKRTATVPVVSSVESLEILLETTRHRCCPIAATDPAKADVPANELPLQWCCC